MGPSTEKPETGPPPGCPRGGRRACADLTQPTNRLLAAVNFANDLGGMPDPGGHGTHVAGIIGGNSTHVDLAYREVAALASTDLTQADYVGIAPGANLVDVRVLNAQGNGRISSAIAGIHRDCRSLWANQLGFPA